MNIVYIINLYILLIFFLLLCITKIYYHYINYNNINKIIVATEVTSLSDIIIVPSNYNSNCNSNYNK